MMSGEETDYEVEMGLKTGVGSPYVSGAAAGKEPQVIQVQRELLQLEAMGEAFCMSVRGMFTPPAHKRPLNGGNNAEISPSILLEVHLCDPALPGQSARTVEMQRPIGCGYLHM